MNHEEILNRILANTCPVGDARKDNLCLFSYDLHCARVFIVARITDRNTTTGPTYDETLIKYEILYSEISDDDDYRGGIERARKFMEEIE